MRHFFLALALSTCASFAAEIDENNYAQPILSAAEMANSGDHAGAIAVLQPLVAQLIEARHSLTSTAVSVLADSYNSLGQSQDSIPLLEHVLQGVTVKQYPVLGVRLLSLLSVAYHMEGQLKKSHQTLLAARKLAGQPQQMAFVESLLARTTLELNEPLAARAHLEQTLHLVALLDGLTPEDLELVWLEAAILDRLGHYADAEEVVASITDVDRVRLVRAQLAESILDFNPERALFWLIDIDCAGWGVDYCAGRFETRGVALYDLGRFQEALPAFDEIIRIGGREDRVDIQGQGWRHWAGAASKVGRLSEAVKAAERALALDPATSPRVRLNLTLLLANTHRQLGHLGRSRMELGRAKQITDDLLESQDELDTELTLSLAALESQLGNLYSIDGELDAAVAAYRRALSFIDSLRSARFSAQTGRDEVENNLVRVLALSGDRSGALELVSRQLDRAGDNPYARAMALLAIGDLTRTLDFRGAAGFLREALTIAESIEHPTLIVSAHHNLAILYAEHGRLSDARRHFVAAIKVTESDPDPLSTYDVYLGASTLVQQIGEPALALDYLTDALDAHESLRMRSGTAASRQSLQARVLEHYTRAVKFAWQLDKLALALEFTERARARLLRDWVENHYQVASTATTERIAWGRLESARDALRHARTVEAQAVAHATFLQLVAEHRREVDMLTKTCALCFETSFAEAFSTSVLQSMLGNDILVSYFSIDSDYIAFVVTEDRVLAKRLTTPRQTIEELIGLFLRFDSTLVPPTNILAQLYDALWAPIQDYVATEGRVLVVPHGPLHQIPFAALWNGSYLIEKHRLATVPSASVVRHLMPTIAPQPVALVVASSDAIPERPLQFADREATAVAAVYDVTPVLQATKRYVTTRFRNANLIHLATHGSLDAANAYESSLWFAPTKSDDGRLNVASVQTLDLAQQSLVILSACDTLRGFNASGDELVALQRAFLAAGARALVASLWLIDDEATAELMVTFHGLVAAGTPISDALRAAQRQLIRNPRWSHPYFWSGFVATSR